MSYYKTCPLCGAHLDSGERNGHRAESMSNWKQAMEAHAEIKRKRPEGAGRDANRFWYVLGLKMKCGHLWSAVS